MSIKISSETIGNRTCDLPACSAVPQPTAPPRTPFYTNRYENFPICVEEIPLCYRIERQYYIYLCSVQQNDILLFNLLATIFGH